MINYCTDQFLQVRYPPGAGGKFLISCLFWFDQVAHWDKQVQHNSSLLLDWHTNSWPQTVGQWPKYEPNDFWNLNFYSRRFERNNHITADEFNHLVELSASKYFFDCWNKNLIITSHWHKRSIPDFFKKARWMEILISARSIDVYKRTVRKKIFFWDQATKTARSGLDDPDLAHSKHNRDVIIKFNNPKLISGFSSYEDFFNKYLLEQPFIKTFINVESDPHCELSIDFADLIERDSFVNVIEYLETIFNQTLDIDKVLQSHAIWTERSEFNN